MKNPLPLAALLLFLPLLGLAATPRASPAAEDATEAIGKELHSVLREMDTLSSELARIEEIVAVPKATSLRIEIRRVGEIASPVSAKLFLAGKAEAEREFPKEERDAFHSGSGPIVWNVPLLPGSYEARLVLSHPYSTQSPSFEFRPSVKGGETFTLRLSLVFTKDGNGAALVVSPEK